MNTQQIKEHMEVLGSDGLHIGTVDYLEEGSSQIVLTRSDSPDGEHHAIPMGWVDHVDTQVHLNQPSTAISFQ